MATSSISGVRTRTLEIRSEAIPQHLGRPALEPVRLSGRDGINSLFEYELLLKAPDALNLGASGAVDFDLDGFIGREITCTIQLDGAGEFIPGVVGDVVDRVGAGTREISALVTEAQFWGEEGRHVQYRLVLRPWLHLATLTSDCKIFQNMTVVELLDELLVDYNFPVEKRLFDEYAIRREQKRSNEAFSALNSFKNAPRQDKQDLIESQKDFLADLYRVEGISKVAQTDGRVRVEQVDQDFLAVLPRPVVPKSVDEFFDKLVHDSHATFYMVGPTTALDRQDIYEKVLDKKKEGKPLSGVEQRILEGKGVWPLLTDADTKELMKYMALYKQVALAATSQSTRRETGGHIHYRRVFDAS